MKKSPRWQAELYALKMEESVEVGIVMLKVKNKKVISEIARTTYKANRKRNFLTVFAIILTTFLISVVIAVGVSYWKTISERQIRMEGMDYDVELSEPRKDQTEKIRSMDSVKYAGIAVKCAVIEKYKDKLLDKTRLYWLDKTCWEKQTIPALESYEGKYPENENEIMLGKNTLKAMGIQNPETGMKLPLTYFTLAEGSGEKRLKKEFILSGWYTDYSRTTRGYVSEMFFKETGVKQTDFTQGTLKITLKNLLYFEEDIIKIQDAIGLDRNQYVAADLDNIPSFLKTAAGLAVLLLMIFASGYLFIYNTMYISVSKDIRYYGQLKTFGMTSVQLKKIIYQQAVWNAVTGIPVGLIMAAVTAKIVIPKLLHIVNPMFSANDVVSVRIWVFLLGGCFSFLVNLVSCQKPAKIAQNCSLVEAIHYTVISGRRKNHKREIGGIYSMAVQNIFRDKKQAVIIFASFIIAISVFIVVNVIIHANDAGFILNEVYSYDIQFKNETTIEDNMQNIITDDKISQIKNTEGVKSVRKVTSTEVVIPYQEDVYGNYYKELYKSRYSPGNYKEDMDLYKKEPENGFFTARFISVDEKGFEILNQSLGNVLNHDDFEQGKTAVALKYFTEGDNGMTGKTVQFYFPDETGQTKHHTIQIAAVGDSYSNPAFFAGGLPPDLIVSEKYAKQLRKELFTELIYVEYKEAYSKEIEEKVKAVFKDNKEISYESKLERYSEMKNTEIQVKVLGNSTGFIIAVLAVLNYLNMIAASIQNRSRELAALESIGMTVRQIKKMLRTEGTGYAIISILLSLIAGLPVSYIVFKGIALYNISFNIPWIRNLILFGIVILLCMTAPVVLYQRTQNVSIIERLHSGQD